MSTNISEMITSKANGPSDLFVVAEKRKTAKRINALVDFINDCIAQAAKYVERPETVIKHNPKQEGKETFSAALTFHDVIHKSSLQDNSKQSSLVGSRLFIRTDSADDCVVGITDDVKHYIIDVFKKAGWDGVAFVDAESSSSPQELVMTAGTKPMDGYHFGVILTSLRKDIGSVPDHLAPNGVVFSLNQQLEYSSFISADHMPKLTQLQDEEKVSN